VRDRDRRTYTVVWVAVTAIAAAILVIVGSPGFALALVAVAGIGLVAFLRATHPRGDHKPQLGIFFDNPSAAAGSANGGSATAAPAPPPPPAPPASAPAPPSGADVINLRQPDRRDRGPAATVTEAVAASNQAREAREVADATGSEDLAEHHVRLLRQVQVKLRDYQ
jgi:hypothetical protein